MNRELKELIELKQYVDYLVEQVVLEYHVPSSKMTKAGHVFQSAGDLFAGIHGYTTRKDLDDKIVEWLIKNPNATANDVQKLRDLARKKIRHNERKTSAIANGIAGGLKGTIIGGPAVGLATGAISAVAGPTISSAKHGIGALLRKTPIGQRSEKDTNDRFLKVASKERKFEKENDTPERKNQIKKEKEINSIFDK